MPEFESNTNTDIVSDGDSLSEMVDVSSISTYNKEVNVEIYHFLAGKEDIVDEDGEPVFVRFVTNSFFNDAEAAAYYESYNAGGRPINNIIGINTGTWRPHLLEDIAEQGYKFRLTIVSHKSMKALLETAKSSFLRDKVYNSTLAWANASMSFFLKVEGVEGWGLESLGFEVDFVKKTSKRLQELSRFASVVLKVPTGGTMWIDAEDKLIVRNSLEFRGERLILAEFRTPVGHDDVDFDGMNGVKESLAKRMGFYKTRGQLRITGRRGTIKGDFVTVPDELMGGADIIFHTENLKPEFRTTGKTFVTLMKHDPIHTAAYDHQSKINNAVVLNARREGLDLMRMLDDAREVITTGTIPEWMELVPESHDDDGLPVYDQKADFNRSYIRWQAAGLSITDSQNYMKMALGGITNRMEKGWVPTKGLYKKSFIPMSNAFNAAVVSYSALTVMLGMEFPQHNGQRAFFDPRYGLVLPDHRFRATYHLHGTWDQDDNTDVIRVPIWSSSLEATANLIADGVIDNITVPPSASEAIEAAVLVRSPNGPGEYSIELIEGDAPWFSMHEDMEPINLADLPRGQGHLLTLVKDQQGLPESTIVFGGAYTPEHALMMIRNQLTNPGIGAVANAMMSWVNVMGVSFPPVMVDVFGEMVDAVQQGMDKDQFAAVKAAANSIYVQLKMAMDADPELKLDRLLAQLRMPKVWRDEIPEGQIVDGRHVGLSNAYHSVKTGINTEMQKHVLETRFTSPLVEKMKAITMTAELNAWARSFYDNYNRAFRQIDAMFKGDSRDNKFQKISKSFGKADAIRALVEREVAELSALGSVNVLALYHFLVTPKRNWPSGYYDRVVFQAASNATSVSDLLIDALIQAGVAY